MMCSYVWCIGLRCSHTNTFVVYIVSLCHVKQEKKNTDFYEAKKNVISVPLELDPGTKLISDATDSIINGPTDFTGFVLKRGRLYLQKIMNKITLSLIHHQR